MPAKISRRSFLQTTALTGAAASAACMSLAPASVDASESTPAPIRFGLASYTFRNFDRAQMIAWLKELGIAELNVKHVKDHLPADPTIEAAAVDAYKAAGIHLHAAGAIYFKNRSEADFRTKFDYCRRAGIGVLVAGDPTPDDLPLLDKLVREYDIRVAIHNHGPEDKLWPSPLDILENIRTLDPRVGCCIDVGHTVRAGTDVVLAITQVGARLHNVHMKDLTDFHYKESQVAVGRGKMPVREIFRALAGINYPGFVDLEYEVHGDDPMPGVRESFAYMRGVLAGMA